MKTAPSIVSRLIPGSLHWLKRDGLVLLLYMLATIIMTYPLATRLGSEWITTNSQGLDVYIKIWDIWWLQQVLSGNGSPLFTQFLFYPNGLDLTYHSLSWTVCFIAWLLMKIVGSAVVAYKVTILLAVWTSAYGGYLLVYELLRKRIPAGLGGAIYSFAPYHIAHSDSHPNLAFTATIPLATLFLIRAVRNESIPAALGAAVMIALTAFTGLYLLDFLAFTYLFLLIFLAIENKRWQRTRFWQVVIVIGLATLILTAWRIGPIAFSLDELSTAIEGVYEADKEQADLLAFVLPASNHELFKPLLADIASRFGRSRGLSPYLGLLPLALTLSALAWRDKAKEVWPWFGIGVFFFLLTLGPVLKINGRLYENVPLLYRLDTWLPPLRAVAPNFFHIALLLPLSVCASYGLQRWLIAFDHKQKLRFAFIATLATFLLFEYWNGYFPTTQVNLPSFYEQLAEEEKGFAIIELPMGRSDSKRYVYYQTIHGHAIVEGAISRTPSQAYRYIDKNLLLSLWLERKNLDCDVVSTNELDEALEQLVGDNFRYVIVHSQPVPEPYNRFFTSEPFYEGNNITVFDLRAMQLTPLCRTQ